MLTGPGSVRQVDERVKERENTTEKGFTTSQGCWTESVPLSRRFLNMAVERNEDRDLKDKSDAKYLYKNINHLLERKENVGRWQVRFLI